MIPADGEDHARIRRHLESRAGMGFETLEQGRNLLGCLDRADPEGSFLLDSTTALLLNEIYPDHETWKPDESAPDRVVREVVEFCQRVANVVVVSDSIYADAFRYNEETENYSSGLARIDREVAKIADVVIEASAGQFIVYKGELL
jgi:adenosyl cobinamide kinase/adenosyl cobinamide phosphate guanylyltransferase